MRSMDRSPSLLGLAVTGLVLPLLVPLLWGALAAAEEPGVPPAPAVAPATPAPPPLLPPAQPMARPAVAPERLQAAPPPVALPPARQTAPLRFDQSLDALVKEGIVSPAERQRIRSGATTSPQQSLAHQQACRNGALSEQECRSGVVVRWRGRNDQPPSEKDALAAAGAEFALAGRSGYFGEPLTTPLTVPVSALLAGPDGSFSLASVFAVTPRPAPVLGNGNRRLLFPLIGSAITSSEFGFRLHPVLGSWLMHAGKDLAAPQGTPVVAALAGRVVSSGLAGGYGLAIEVEHDNPRRRTLYGHLSELYVKPGDRVRQGEVIGRVGSTGLSTGPHLHFELRLPSSGGWVAVDPGDLDPGAAAVGSDAIAMLMGQLLQRLERPQPAVALSR